MTLNELQEISVLLSLGTTFPTVVLAFTVIYAWCPAAIAAIRKGSPLAHDWFVVGVVAGFIGSALDNIFWFFPWTANFLNHPEFLNMVELGVFSNILFRQGFGVLAAYCHLKAANISSHSCIFQGLNRLLMASNLVGVGYCTLLILANSN